MSIRLQLFASATELPSDPLDLVRAGFCDPVAVMIKGEPHNREKISTGRLRVICLVSIADEVVERLMYANQNEAEIMEWATCPSKPGIGFSEEQVTEFVRNLPNCVVVSSDVKGWDFCVSEWGFDIDDKFRCYSTGLDETSLFYRCLSKRSYVFCRSLFVLSDGTLLKQLSPGVMKSGSYRTSSSNSRIRVAAALIVGAPWAQAMGDDAIEGESEDKEARYLAIGVNFVRSLVDRDKVDFCSHTFVRGDDCAVPCNWDKMLYRLLSHAPNFELLAQFRYEMRHSPQLEFATEVLSRVGWDPTNI